MNYIRIFLITTVLFISCKSDKNPINSDSQTPTVEIISPANQEVVSEIVAIQCHVVSAYKISKVRIKVDDEFLQQTLTEEPFQFNWNSLNYPDSSFHIIKAIVEDINRNEGISDSIIVMVDNSSASPNSTKIISANINDLNIEVIWNKAQEDDFFSYTVEQSTDSTFIQKTIIYNTYDKNDTSVVLLDIFPIIPHFFRIVVTDSVGLKSFSDVFESEVAQEPEGLNITDVTYNFDNMSVAWEKTSLKTFSSYNLLYSISQSGLKDTIAIINESSNTSYVLNDFDPTRENWFWICVEDRWKRQATGQGMSNQIDPFPESVNINSILYNNSKFILNWEKNNDDDFISYQLLESDNINMENPDVVFTSGDQMSTSTTLSGITYEEERYYQMQVVDYWEQISTGGTKKGSALYKIAYVANQNGTDQIYWMNEDGSEQERIVKSSTVFKGSPIWSPDLTRIYYQMGTSDINLYSITTDFISNKQLTHMTGWSRDLVTTSTGDYLVFRNNKSLYKMNMEGDELTQLTEENGLILWPDISPDNQQVVWAVQDDGWHIKIMSLDGSNKRLLTSNSGWDARIPKFSNDDQLVYYWARNQERGVLSDIFSVDMNENEVNITNHDELLGYTDYFDISPSGKYIVYDLIRPDESEIILLDLHNGMKMRLSASPSDRDHQPKFSNDGLWIFFTSGHSGSIDIYKVNLEGTIIHQLTNDSNDNYLPSPQPIFIN
jgi:Tol biopolymer transport system component